jgi:hypothetical protein
MNLSNVVLCARHEIPGAVQIASSGHYIDIYFDSDQTQINTDAAAAFAYDYGGHVAFSQGNHVALVFPEGRGRNPHKRVQISLKLEKDVDHDIITFLDTVENRQGLIKRLIREHMHNLTLLDIERGLSRGSDN